MKPSVKLSFSFASALAVTGGVTLAQPEQMAPEPEKPQEAFVAAVPALDPELESQAAALAPEELIRVLIFLRPSPLPVVAQGSALSAAQEDLAEMRAEVGEILERASAYRDWQDPTKPDSAHYAQMFEAMTAADGQRLRELNERNEELSAAVAQGQTVRMAGALQEVQERVAGQLERLGATVEFTAIAGSVMVARVPAGALSEIAALADVARVAEDRKVDAHLNIADDATMVSATGGLWPNGLTGGSYDPAVVDSGTDLSHPFLAVNANRENHWSWYLVAGLGDPAYNDVTSGTQTQWVDDLQGHGTHVMGIVASEGSTSYPNLRGMSYGVDKTVHLKAGWRNIYGTASMYWSDKMWLVDRALNHEDELRPTYGTDEFLDDVDGFNLSYGGATASDDPQGGQFWDAVVDDFSDMVVTISAGNSGPSNTVFNDPATSYNAIAVANVDDQNTAARSDDTIRSSSTRGPTALGRKKPDIAAPGTSIASANTFWETQTDYVNFTGTSMAAPMVLGVAMDLMDAGVWDEKWIKALLLNTAQKNEAGINFESDADGWSTAYGWGYMNAWAAYYHRSDVHTGSVTPNGTPDDYDLWVGQMRDEGSSAEGRDRATLVWNRHATYTDHAYPSTVYALNDVDLYLYNESNGALFDFDTTIRDNVHQVRVASGAGVTDVVVKVNAFSASFNGVSSESYALATEEGFSAATPPTFAVTFGIPATVNAGANFTVDVNVANNGGVASHGNSVDLSLPGGFSIVSGADPQNIGSIAASGTGTATWTVQASSTPATYGLVAANSSSSYGEVYSGNGSDTIVVQSGPSLSPDKVGLHRGNRFYFDTNGNRIWDPAAGDVTFTFGLNTDTPVTGDWNADGVDEAGVRRGNRFYLDVNGNGLWDPAGGDVTFPFGLPTDTPIIGDWNGDGVDDVGLHRANRFYFDANGNRVWDPASGDVTFTFGLNTDTPVIGDWNADGVDNIGLRRGNRFYFDVNGNGFWDPAGGDVTFTFGVNTDIPVIGDWNADGVDDAGLRRGNRFYLDADGSRSWSAVSDVTFTFGLSTDTPLAGRW